MSHSTTVMHAFSQARVDRGRGSGAWSPIGESVALHSSYIRALGYGSNRRMKYAVRSPNRLVPNRTRELQRPNSRAELKFPVRSSSRGARASCLRWVGATWPWGGPRAGRGPWGPRVRVSCRHDSTHVDPHMKGTCDAIFPITMRCAAAGGPRVRRACACACARVR